MGGEKVINPPPWKEDMILQEEAYNGIFRFYQQNKFPLSMGGPRRTPLELQRFLRVLLLAKCFPIGFQWEKTAFFLSGEETPTKRAIGPPFYLNTFVAWAKKILVKI